MGLFPRRSKHIVIHHLKSALLTIACCSPCRRLCSHCRSTPRSPPSLSAIRTPDPQLVDSRLDEEPGRLFRHALRALRARALEPRASSRPPARRRHRHRPRHLEPFSHPISNCHFTSISISRCDLTTRPSSSSFSSIHSCPLVHAPTPPYHRGSSNTAYKAAPYHRLSSPHHHDTTRPRLSPYPDSTRLDFDTLQPPSMLRVTCK